MIKAVRLVPERNNRGRLFPRRSWIEFEARLRAFGGFSRILGVIGQWVATDGRIYTDRSRQYTVALRQWTDLADWLVIVAWAQALFEQEAMYIEVAGIPNIINLRNND